MFALGWFFTFFVISFLASIPTGMLQPESLFLWIVFVVQCVVVVMISLGLDACARGDVDDQSELVRSWAALGNCLMGAFLVAPFGLPVVMWRTGVLESLVGPLLLAGVWTLGVIGFMVSFNHHDAAEL